MANRFVRDLEKIEIDVWNEFDNYADGETARSSGIKPDYGELLSILIAPKLDIPGMNRIIGRAGTRQTGNKDRFRFGPFII